jgi:hypothetical protein
VPTFDLLALLGKRAEEQSAKRVKTPPFRGLMKEHLRWKDKPSLGVSTNSHPRRAAPMLQPGTSVVAPLTKAQQRRLQKAEHAAWKNRHVQQVCKVTPYDDYRTSINGIDMIAQIVRPTQTQPHSTSHSARGIAGEVDSMGRRGTAAAARLGGGISYRQRAIDGLTESHAIAAIRNLGRSSVANQRQQQQQQQQQQQHKLGQQREHGHLPSVSTSRGKVLSNIRASSPMRLPLPTAHRTASPLRGIVDFFPDGAQMTNRVYK